MDTIDRPDSNLPARYPGDSPRVLAPIAAGSRDLAVASPTAPQVTPEAIMRGLSRHKVRIMLFWLGLSIPLAILIWTLVKPTYEAVSRLKAEPNLMEIYNTQSHGTSTITDVKPFLLTQVQLITSDTVLDLALSKPEISNLPMIRSLNDPKVDLREEMRVEIVGENTYLIEVALESPDPIEAAKIVNAVVKAYVEEHDRDHENRNRELKKTLEGELTKMAGKITTTEKKLTDLVEKGNVFVKSKLTPAGKEEDGAFQPSFSTVSASRYEQATAELLATDLQLIDARAALVTVKTELARAQQVATGDGDERSQLEAEQLDDQIREEFLKDPDVQPLIEKLSETKDALENNRGMARQVNDSSILAAQKQYNRLMRQWNELWKQKKDEIEERLRAGDEDQRPEAWSDKAAELETTIDELKNKRVGLTSMIQGLAVESTAKNADQLRASMLNQDLSYLKKLQDAVMQKLGQTEFEVSHEAYNITVVDKAAVPQQPSNNKRLKLVLVAPVGVLFLMLGLFLMLEIKAERVADPDALSTRMQSEVYALPPLPSPRSLRKRNTPKTDDQLDQFIQRLDHLRFAVCGNPAELQKGRCVLITSAIGGEGKTTLAAQLALRCGQAGMSTLLIDADMRQTGLCSLLEIAEGPGLSDALNFDELAATELVVPVQGGTFDLLAAGTQVPDVSQVLQNRKLGLLITQFRQRYDLVIIDSPPVLPVPDALILGRWADGAVLAVRFDISRFPQVERARRQLDGAGIAVLGTVINGMKNSDSYYGRYSHSRRQSPQADSPAAL